jgi:hypothetical protein
MYYSLYIRCFIGESAIMHDNHTCIVVKFHSNDFKNSAADVRRKFVVVILPGTSFLYLFSFIGNLHVFSMV